MPEGVGINGVVFETQRPDDPEAFANRHKERMAMQKSQISFADEYCSFNDNKVSELADEDLKEVLS